MDGSEYLNSSLECVTQYPPFSTSSLSLGEPETPLWAPKGPQYTVLELLGGAGVLTRRPLDFNVLWAVLRVLLVDCTLVCL